MESNTDRQSATLVLMMKHMHVELNGSFVSEFDMLSFVTFNL